MIETLIEILKTAPPLVVLVAVVWVFLKHLKDRDEQFASVVRQINSENLEARLSSRSVIETNSEVLAKNIETRGELMEVIRELKEKL